MNSELTQAFPFFRTILSCLPSDILSYFYLVLSILITVIFVRLIINVLG